jgi:hypothetical protein
MDNSPHNMQTLFLQLGLPSKPEDIEAFLDSHARLPINVALPEADFWNFAQSAFLKEAIEDDSDWSEIVDELDNLLRGSLGG